MVSSTLRLRTGFDARGVVANALAAGDGGGVFGVEAVELVDEVVFLAAEVVVGAEGAADGAGYLGTGALVGL